MTLLVIHHTLVQDVDGKGYSQRRRACLAVMSVLGICGVWPSTTGEAQGLSRSITDRCLRASVLIHAITSTGEVVSTGSGAFVRPDGFILTNFHVVGNVHPVSGAFGTLINSDNIYAISATDSARSPITARYLAQVVRADARLDLALLKVVANIDGSPASLLARYPSVSVGTSRHTRPGTRVWAFGFPLGVETVNVTGGAITGFQPNALGQVAWLRTDAEFNPGNSGGMLVDARGQLVGVPTAVLRGSRTTEPIELARPAERIPREWIDAPSSVLSTPGSITGGVLLDRGARVTLSMVGDDADLSHTELGYLALSDRLRPGVVMVSPDDVDVALVSQSGEVLRSGTGSVDVGRNDPQHLTVVVAVHSAPGQTTWIVVTGEDLRDERSIRAEEAFEQAERVRPTAAELRIDLPTSMRGDELAPALTERITAVRSTYLQPYLAALDAVGDLADPEYTALAHVRQAQALEALVAAVTEAVARIDYLNLVRSNFRQRTVLELQRRGIVGTEAERVLAAVMQRAESEGSFSEAAATVSETIESEVTLAARPPLCRALEHYRRAETLTARYGLALQGARDIEARHAALEDSVGNYCATNPATGSGGLFGP